MIKVSIIIPVYNVAEYIEKCLLSVLNQSYTNIECILVDDCSPDDSIRIAQEFISLHDSDIDTKILRHEVNSGLSAARNTGLKAATGDYVYFLDSDDEIFPYTIEAMVQLCIKYRNVDLVQGSTKVIPSQKGREWLDIKNKELPEYSSDHLWIKKGMLKGFLFSMTAWNKLVRKEFLLANELFFKVGIIHEDEHWNFFIAKKIQSIAFCKKDTYLYRVNDAGIMGVGYGPKNFRSTNIIITDMCNNIDDICSREQKRCALDMCLGTYNRVLRYESLKEYIPEIKNRVDDVKKLYKSPTLFSIVFFLNNRKDSSPRILKYIIRKALYFFKRILY